MKTTNVVRPEAYIAVGKNRQKIDGENTVYLSDKQEFQFEIFNPMTDNIMAKISINGNLISNRGLILRPGMRGWLERYIDQNRKFLFETYSVDGESKAVQKAIADNGNVKIEFFKERKIETNFKGYFNITTNCPNPDYAYYRNNIVSSKGNVSTYTNGSKHSFNTNSLADYVPEEMSMFNSSFCDSIPDTLSRDCDSTPKEGIRGIADMQLKSRAKLSKSIETGRIEKGDVSEQEFKAVDMQFEYTPFFSISYKLMPISQKPAEFNEIKLKCKKCGSRTKSNWKNCPICGQPINDEEKCKSCGTKVEQAWNFCPTCNNRLK